MKLSSIKISIPIEWIEKAWKKFFGKKKKTYLVQEGMQFPFCGMWFKVKRVNDKGIWCEPFGVTKKLKPFLNKKEK